MTATPSRSNHRETGLRRLAAPTVTRPVAAPSPTPAPTPVLPPTVSALLAAGDEALLISDFTRAEPAFQAALKLDAQSAAAHAGLSRTYVVQMGRVKAALAEAQQAVNLDAYYAPGWIALANAQADLGLAADR